MKSFNILALDKEFNIVSIVPFVQLQWSRKYHEPGSFSISVPLNVYSSEWKYIYTPDRCEMGEISQINYICNNSIKTMYVSGHFLEYQLNNMVVYPYSSIEWNDQTFYEEDGPATIVKGKQPTWTVQRGRANVVAHRFFNDFKKIEFRNFPIDDDGTGNQNLKNIYGLDINDGTSESLNGEYKITTDTRNGEQLGDKIYSILKPSGASYRIRFDFENAIKYFDVIKGRDRTEASTSANPVVFSTKYGNIVNPNILISNTDYKDCIIQAGESSFTDKEEDVTNRDFIVIASSYFQNSTGKFCYKDSSLNMEFDSSHDFESPFYNVKMQFNAMADEELKTRQEIINVDFDALEGSYEYMVDFDIGDLVSIEVPEINFSADARLIGCYETIEDGVWSLSMEFGTPIIKNK